MNIIIYYDMGSSNSSIPEPYPGQFLKLIGINRYDGFYSGLEEDIQSIDLFRIDIDLRFTDFIKSLGAERLWERSTNFDEMLRMMIIVIASNMKKELTSITFKHEIPYLDFHVKKLSKNIQNLFENFTEYVKKISLYNAKLIEIKEKHIGIDEELDGFQDTISDDVIDQNYSPEDIVKAIQIVDSNSKLIKKSFSSLDKMLELEGTVKNRVSTVFHESIEPTRFGRIIQQAAQAKFEGLSSPEAIVNYFWPYPINN